MGIGDDQLHSSQAALDQALQEGRPEGLGLRGTDAKADDLAPAIGIGSDGDYRRHRDDPAALADFEVGGVEPEIRPFALQWSVEEGADPLGLSGILCVRP